MLRRANIRLEQPMLRFTIACVLALVVSGSAMSADRTLPGPASHHVRHRAAVMLPAGLPRPHYRFRTTISYRTTYVQESGPRLSSVHENPRLLYSPDYAEVSYTRRAIRRPLLRPYSALPAYEPVYAYDEGYPAYAAYIGYEDRLPYACGGYGYC
jgi:hypothetical protein